MFTFKEEMDESTEDKPHGGPCLPVRHVWPRLLEQNMGCCENSNASGKEDCEQEGHGHRIGGVVGHGSVQWPVWMERELVRRILDGGYRDVHCERSCDGAREVRLRERDRGPRTQNGEYARGLGG